MKFWTTTELRLLKELYPMLGPKGLLERLPGRTYTQITDMASRQGLKFLGLRRRSTKKYHATPAIDAALRAHYAQPAERGAGGTRPIAEAHGVPTWWLKRRANELGLARPAKRQPAWSEEEDELLAELHKKHQIETIARKMRAAGFKRSRTAILVHLKRLGLSRRADNRYTATGLAKRLGVDPSTVSWWCEKDWIPAERMESARTAAQGGDIWLLEHRDVRQFVLRNPHLIDLRKITDAEWFIALVAGRPADGRQNRRKGPDRSEARPSPPPPAAAPPD